jgi:outer membrane phospholipase A
MSAAPPPRRTMRDVAPRAGPLHAPAHGWPAAIARLSPVVHRTAARLVLSLAPAFALLAAWMIVSPARADQDPTSYLPGGQSGARFDLLEPSYFITGNDCNDDPTNPVKNDQVRFRLGVRYRLGDLSDLVPSLRDDLQTQLYFAFTQDAFWNLYDESAPFYENNFAPESYVYVRHRTWPFGTTLGVKHQSNGRDGPLSRSWNRYYAAFAFGEPRKNAFFGTVTAWKTWGIGDENPDIKDHLGRGELMIYFAPGALWTPTRFRFDQLGFLFRVPVWGKKVFPAFEGTILIRLQKEAVFAPSIVVQYFAGTGLMLREYERNQAVWRFGLGMSR